MDRFQIQEVITSLKIRNTVKRNVQKIMELENRKKTLNFNLQIFILNSGFLATQVHHPIVAISFFAFSAAGLFVCLKPVASR